MLSTTAKHTGKLPLETAGNGGRTYLGEAVPLDQGGTFDDQSLNGACREFVYHRWPNSLWPHSTRRTRLPVSHSSNDARNEPIRPAQTVRDDHRAIV